MTTVDVRSFTPADAIRRTMDLHGAEIQGKRRSAARIVLSEGVAEQATPQARRVVDTFAGLGKWVTPLQLFETALASGLPDLLYPRGVAIVESARTNGQTNARHQWQTEVFSGIGQGYLEGCVDFGNGTTVITPAKTAEACQKILPEAREDRIPPDGFIMRDGRISAAVFYELAPDRNKIASKWRDFRVYAQAFGDLCVENPGVMVVTPQLERKDQRRLIPGIPSLAPITVPATSHEIRAHANLLFDVHRPDVGGQTLANILEFGRSKSVQTSR